MTALKDQHASSQPGKINLAMATTSFNVITTFAEGRLTPVVGLM